MIFIEFIVFTQSNFDLEHLGGIPMVSLFRVRNLSVLCYFVLFLSLLMQPTLGLAAETTPTKTCTSHQFLVALQAGESANYQVTGTLCSLGDPTGKTIQVLVHGFTLNQTYWDLPYHPEIYSYVDSLTQAGYTTLSLDRIGVGKSSHPTATDITLDSNTYVLHQIIQQLRAGQLNSYQFPKVMLVGHSFGSTVSANEASTYNDVDGLVLTGFIHTAAPVGTTAMAAGVTPAQLDPVFFNDNLPVGYVTTSKLGRQVFYNPDDTDPAIYDIDNNTKGTGTDGELLTLTSGGSPTMTQNIHVPVLLVVGEKDNLFCDALLSCANSAAIIEREQSYYSTNLEAYVLSGSGHNLNYQLNTQDYYNKVKSWSDSHIGAN